jgi:hypothetical protein
VVQKLSMDTHLLAWIWMVIVAVPLLEQGAASRLSSNTLLGWGPAYLFASVALCIVLLAAKCLARSMLVIWPSPWRLLDSLAITTHTASISNQGIYIYI